MIGNGEFLKWHLAQDVSGWETTLLVTYCRGPCGTNLQHHVVDQLEGEQSSVQSPDVELVFQVLIHVFTPPLQALFLLFYFRVYKSHLVQVFEMQL